MTSRFSTIALLTLALSWTVLAQTPVADARRQAGKSR